jgi:hypothetical protein
MRNRPKAPILPVPAPVCPTCGTTVRALLCQASPRTPADVEAIQALLLAMHNRLAGHAAQDPTTERTPT